MEEAKARLQHAIDLDNDIRRLALDDEDLQPCGTGPLGFLALRGGDHSPIWSRCSHWRKSPLKPKLSAIWNADYTAFDALTRLPDLPAVSDACDTLCGIARDELELPNLCKLQVLKVKGSTLWVTSVDPLCARISSPNRSRRSKKRNILSIRP
jgi:hypothetical protein